MIIIAGFGIKVSIHHVWLTELPPEQQPLSCGMPLDVMYQNLPFWHFLHKVLMGSAECAKVNWQILGINAPTAVTLLFTLILLLVFGILVTDITNKF
jgi:disulfide bond formation protein DsbB